MRELVFTARKSFSNSREDRVPFVDGKGTHTGSQNPTIQVWCVTGLPSGLPHVRRSGRKLQRDLNSVVLYQ